MTPQQRASVIFEAYRSDDRARWEPAYDEVVAIIQQRDDLLAEVAALKKDLADQKTSDDWL